MSDMARDGSIGLRATLTQRGEKYCSPCAIDANPKRPAGVYDCPECGDAQITFRTPVDKFKTKCPKCNTEMVRVTAIKPKLLELPLL